MKRICLAVLLLAATPSIVAQAYPNRPIRMIVPFTAGSGSDTVARLIAPKLLDGLGQRVIVDNRAGAGSTIGTAMVAAATPDGHTLLLTSSGFAGAASLYQKLPYDTVRDFAGITPVMSTALMLVAAPSLGVKSMKDLVALAKQKPGFLTYASTGVGSGTHYGAELFRRAAGFEATHVPYKGVPEAMNDVMTGRVNFYVASVQAVVPLAREGRVTALAITGPQRSRLLPEVPTMAEAGLPRFEYVGWWGMLVPARTPRAIVDQLSKEMKRILDLPEIREKFEGLGGEAWWTSTQAFDRLIRTEVGTRAKIFGPASTQVQ
jgi:tripartite-type tricarboxylate transporter receptor subunit TctC